MEQISPSAKRFVTAVMITSSLGGLAFGYDTGVVNGALPYMAEPDQLNLTPVLEGFVVSALLIGAAIGSVTSGRIADLLGRRKMIIYLSLIFFFAAMGCTLAPSVWFMLPCRFALGLAVGGASVAVPVYLAEVSPADKRGRMITQNELMIVSGQFLAFIFNAILGVAFDGTAHVWRYMLFMATIPAACLFFGMLRMPDSPRYMVLKGEVSKAMEVLVKLRGSKRIAMAEINEIQDSIAQENSIKQFTWADLKRPWIRRILFIGIGVALCSRCTGVNSIMFYGTQVLTEAGFARQMALIANIANGLTSVLATFLGIYLLGKIGRVRMFFTGVCGTMFSLIIITIAANTIAGTPMLPYVILSMTILFLTFVQGFIGPVFWVIIAEVFPLQLRGLGMGICICFMWIVEFIIGTSFPVMLNTLGLSGSYIAFIVLQVMALCFIGTQIPETKGKTLEQLERYFRSKYGAGPAETASAKA